MTTNGIRARLSSTRIRGLVNELGKFGVIGSVAFVIDFAIFNWLHFGLDIGPITSTTLSTLVAMTFAYFGNRLWTWRDRRRVGFRREYFLFAVINGGGLAIQDAILGFTFYVLDLRSPVAVNVWGKIIGVAFATVFRFWAYRKWVFPHEQETSPPAEDGALEATTITPY